jgi:tRNA(fMet)-specific endonuclease VapC
MYMLDANIISDLVRHPGGRSAARLAQIEPDQVVTSVVVSAEVWFGVERRGSSDLEWKVSNVMRRISITEFAAPADRIHAAIRTALEKTGLLIGPNDLLIAAHALALGATLVTGNEREFSRVPGLKIENWLR